MRFPATSTVISGGLALCALLATGAAPASAGTDPHDVWFDLSITSASNQATMAKIGRTVVARARIDNAGTTTTKPRFCAISKNITVVVRFYSGWTNTYHRSVGQSCYQATWRDDARWFRVYSDGTWSDVIRLSRGRDAAHSL